jgi:hypothetical protein
MSASLRALLAGIVDYAGLFPPATLPLDQALHNFAQYRQGADQWMLGRFIVPATRLTELTAFDTLFHDQPPFLFCVLGHGGKTSDEFLKSLDTDLTQIAHFRDRHPGRVEVDVLEIKLPEEMVRPVNHQAAIDALVRASELIERHGPPELTPYFEIAFGADWRVALVAALALLQKVQEVVFNRLKRCRPPGFKLRCGGLEPTAFPTPHQVAAAITGCRDHGVALKATAGLHHPLRRFDPALPTHMHGFVNVFGGAVLTAVHRFDERLLEMILADEEAGHFVFSDEGFCWGKLWASVERIRAARQQFAIGFGSCSFEEPREDLRALGWLQ